MVTQNQNQRYCCSTVPHGGVFCGGRSTKYRKYRLEKQLEKPSNQEKRSKVSEELGRGNEKWEDEGRKGGVQVMREGKRRESRKHEMKERWRRGQSEKRDMGERGKKKKACSQSRTMSRHEVCLFVWACDCCASVFILRVIHVRGSRSGD